MASLNRITLIGRLGRDPEARATPNGLQVANLNVATSYKPKNGDEIVEWHKCVFYGRQAEICEQYLRKGSLVYIEGRVQTRKYTDRDGIERYQTEVVGERMQMLGGRDDNQQQGGKPSDDFESQGKAPGSDYAKAKGGAKQPESFDDLGDDLPF